MKPSYETGNVKISGNKNEKNVNESLAEMSEPAEEYRYYLFAGKEFLQ